MKKNSLTTAIVAGIAGVAGFAGLANAAYLNPDGIGQVLLYPYYTVNSGQQTLLAVTNTSSAQAKAIKVRFLEGYNSREVLDFNLYLSNYDVWTATIFALGDTPAAMTPHFDTVPIVDSTPAGHFELIAMDQLASRNADWVITFPTREFYVDPPPPAYDRIGSKRGMRNYGRS